MRPFEVFANIMISVKDSSELSVIIERDCGSLWDSSRPTQALVSE